MQKPSEVKKHHPSVESALTLFSFHPLPGIQGEIQQVRDNCETLALYMAETLPQNPALTRGLIQLWEAKNEFVAALVLEHSPKKDYPKKD